MAKYLFAYHGGKEPANEAEIKAVSDAWGNWLGSLGTAVIDGGNPCGESTVLKGDGSATTGASPNPVTGYSLIEAANLEDALAKAKNCPIFESGGEIELAEAFDM